MPSRPHSWNRRRRSRPGRKHPRVSKHWRRRKVSPSMPVYRPLGDAGTGAAGALHAPNARYPRMSHLRCAVESAQEPDTDLRIPAVARGAAARRVPASMTVMLGVLVMIGWLGYRHWIAGDHAASDVPAATSAIIEPNGPVTGVEMTAPPISGPRRNRLPDALNHLPPTLIRRHHASRRPMPLRRDHGAQRAGSTGGRPGSEVAGNAPQPVRENGVATLPDEGVPRRCTGAGASNRSRLPHQRSRRRRPQRRRNTPQTATAMVMATIRRRLPGSPTTGPLIHRPRHASNLLDSSDRSGHARRAHRGAGAADRNTRLTCRLDTAPGLLSSCSLPYWRRLPQAPMPAALHRPIA
jgi:hypothetical protein